MDEKAPIRVRLTLQGDVQGVGLRPFVHRLAHAHGLSGFVQNQGDRALLEVEGSAAALAHFRESLARDLPRPAVITAVEAEALAPLGDTRFEIRESRVGAHATRVLPDQRTCPDCLRELFDPEDRRFRYPFINCARCGPRYSILERLPYDRQHTTMARFAMCRACEEEYDDPGDRRYHAQPNACPACGPRLRLEDPGGGVLARGGEALTQAVARLRDGQVLAVKGIGGFHLMADARSETTLRRLRERKNRQCKPFAVMCPSLEHARQLCVLSELEAELLDSSAAPIVLATKRETATRALAASVAPGHPDLGVLLPYTPLHHLLVEDVGAPLLATSGNVADEVICTDDADAHLRLAHLADALLCHDRPIARAAEDSVIRVMAGRPVLLRRGRGYAPAIVGRLASHQPALAVGAHLKNAPALAVHGDVWLAPHVGSLDAEASREHLRLLAGDLCSLARVQPTRIVADLHPGYGSRPLAERLRDAHHARLWEVQHHEAHLWACLTDAGRRPPCLGVVWDGMGLGPDGTLWGGEFLLAREGAAPPLRVAHLRPFSLVGGDTAARDARRAALGVLHELGGDAACGEALTRGELSLSPHELSRLLKALSNPRSAVQTSSAGRLFDAAAALLSLCQQSDYEGHAAGTLEHAARCFEGETRLYPHELREGRAVQNPAEPTPLVLDWGPLVEALLADRRAGAPPACCAARFHAGLSDAIVRVAERVGVPTVALTGGCFQNRTLLEQTVRRLELAGFEALWHGSIPPNDGGLAVGQLAVAAEREREVS